jgi:hypothetical protein
MARPKKSTAALITWLGEDELHLDEAGNGNGPRFNTWNGVRFELGEPVLVENEHMIEKAKTNRFYRVEHADGGGDD